MNATLILSFSIEMNKKRKLKSIALILRLKLQMITRKTKMHLLDPIDQEFYPQNRLLKYIHYTD